MLSQKPDAKHVWQDFIYIKFKNRQMCQLYLSKARGGKKIPGKCGAGVQVVATFREEEER